LFATVSLAILIISHLLYMLTVPLGVKTYELPTSVIWVEPSGIVCSIAKKRQRPQTVEEVRQVIDMYKSIVGEKPRCLLADVTHSSATSREVREYAATELPKLIKAVAMVSESVVGKMMANIFFSLKHQPYPVKMFNDETEAREWLIKYL
jgi:hypothetical protein